MCWNKAQPDPCLAHTASRPPMALACLTRCNRCTGMMHRSASPWVPWLSGLAAGSAFQRTLTPLHLAPSPSSRGFDSTLPLIMLHCVVFTPSLAPVQRRPGASRAVLEQQVQGRLVRAPTRGHSAHPPTPLHPPYYLASVIRVMFVGEVCFSRRDLTGGRQRASDNRRVTPNVLGCERCQWETWSRGSVVGSGDWRGDWRG